MAGRVSELMALADGGSEEAISDLFKEFGIEYEPKEYGIGGSVERGNTISNKDMAMLRSMISTELSDSDSANSISDKDMALIKSLLSKSANSISDRDAALVKELITGRGKVRPKAKGGQVGYMGGGHVKMKGYKSGGKVGYSMAGTGAAVKGTSCKGLF